MVAYNKNEKKISWFKDSENSVLPEVVCEDFWAWAS